MYWLMYSTGGSAPHTLRHPFSHDSWPKAWSFVHYVLNSVFLELGTPSFIFVGPEPHVASCQTGNLINAVKKTGSIHWFQSCSSSLISESLIQMLHQTISLWVIHFSPNRLHTQQFKTGWHEGCALVHQNLSQDSDTGIMCAGCCRSSCCRFWVSQVCCFVFC